MKSWVPFAGIVILLAVAVIGWQWHSRSNGLPTRAGGAPSQAVLGVEDLMRNVDHHQGGIQVEGVVSAASSNDQTLALIDTEEFRQCGCTNCARLTLPVRWTGTMPSLQDTVRLEGEVQNSGGKLIFVARRLEKVEPQQGGAK